MSLLTEVINLADTPAGCEEAEAYRAGLGKMTDYAAKGLEDRITNLEWCLKRVPFTDFREKEDMRRTIDVLTQEHREFFKGEQGKGRSR